MKKEVMNIHTDKNIDTAKILIATLKHEISNTLNATALANELLVMKKGETAENRVIERSVLKISAVLNRLSDIKNLKIKKYAGGLMIFDIEGD